MISDGIIDVLKQLGKSLVHVYDAVMRNLASFLFAPYQVGLSGTSVNGSGCAPTAQALTYAAYARRLACLQLEHAEKL